MPGFEQQPPPLFKQGPAPLALLILYVCSSISLLILDDRFRYLEPLRSVVTEAVSPLKKVEVNHLAKQESKQLGFQCISKGE